VKKLILARRCYSGGGRQGTARRSSSIHSFTFSMRVRHLTDEPRPVTNPGGEANEQGEAEGQEHVSCK
jgi:hypothetical protein